MDPKQKIEAIFYQIKKTVFFYNTRMRQVNKRRLDTMAIVTDLGINDLDTRPFDRHLQINVKKRKQSVASEPLFLQTNAINAIFQRDDKIIRCCVRLEIYISIKTYKIK
ncbi:unnamed protein product, partial [Oikopleura dioica]